VNSGNTDNSVHATKQSDDTSGQEDNEGSTLRNVGEDGSVGRDLGGFGYSNNVRNSNNYEGSIKGAEFSPEIRYRDHNRTAYHGPSDPVTQWEEEETIVKKFPKMTPESNATVLDGMVVGKSTR